MKKHIKNKKSRNSFKQVEIKQILASILIRTNNSLSKIISSSRKAGTKFSLTRIKNFCVLTGRSSGICTYFKISRIKLRNLALDGLLNGIKKASW
jgi:small subunit ribosomal protein S14